MLIAGVDCGFRKLGMSILELDKSGSSSLLLAETKETKPGSGKQMMEDYRSCWELARHFDKFLREHTPKYVFLELPSGGGQGARAHRCMGMSTAVMAAVLSFHPKIRFECFLPSTVEELLGIRMPREKGVKLKKGEMTAFKKRRLEEAVLSVFPLFNGWPKTLRLREDAVDSVAVALAGCHARSGAWDLMPKRGLVTKPTV